jgi:hypothetical protein
MYPQMQRSLWKEVAIDFGHELVTAIHMPLVWSNERPNAEEYTEAFAKASLSSAKVWKQPPIMSSVGMEWNATPIIITAAS